MTLSNLPPLVTIFGGSGFVGRHVVRALAKRGYRIRVAVRRPDLAGHLQPLGNVGQISFVQANLRYRNSVDRAVDGADHVINCVGVLFENGRNTFDAVQDFGARAVAEAARATGATLTHISAIGADARSDSSYARTKGRAEAAILEILPTAVILRPSIIFGPEDGFFNKFAEWLGSRRSCRSSAAAIQVSAGLRHGRRRGCGPLRRRQARGWHDLRTRWTAGALVPRMSRYHAEDDRPQALLRLAPLRHRLSDGQRRFAGAVHRTAAHGRSGRVAEIGQCRFRNG